MHDTSPEKIQFWVFLFFQAEVGHGHQHLSLPFTLRLHLAAGIWRVEVNVFGQLVGILTKGFKNG